MDSQSSAQLLATQPPDSLPRLPGAIGLACRGRTWLPGESLPLPVPSRGHLKGNQVSLANLVRTADIVDALLGSPTLTTQCPPSALHLLAPVCLAQASFATLEARSARESLALKHGLMGGADTPHSASWTTLRLRSHTGSHSPQQLPLPTVLTGPRKCPLLNCLFCLTSAHHVLCAASPHTG